MLRPIEVLQEPIEMFDLKSFSKVHHDMEDELLDTFISAAREHAESFTRRSIAEQKWRYTLDGLPSEKFIKLPVPPLKSVESITLVNDEGEEHELQQGAYFVDTNSEPGRIMLGSGDFWQSFKPFPISSVVIDFIAGYEPNSVPKSVQQAIRLLAGHMYDNREIITTSGTVNKVPFAFESLLYPHRVW